MNYNTMPRDELEALELADCEKCGSFRELHVIRDFTVNDVHSVMCSKCNKDIDSLDLNDLLPKYLKYQPLRVTNDKQ